MDNDTNNADTDTDMDDQLTQFLSITGSGDTNQARSYLEMSGHDLQTAISLFMEHQGGGGSGSGNSSGATGAMGVGGMGMGSPDVRAPDETRRMRLLDFQDGSSGGGAAAEHAAAMSRMGAGLMDHPLLGPHARMAMAGNAAMGMGGNMNPLANAAMHAFADIHGNGNDDDSLGNMNANVDGNSGLGDTAAIAAGLGLNVNADANANAENMNMNMDGSLRDIMNRAASASSSNGTTSGLLASASASASASSNSTRLASMFAEPTHLTHKAGGFQGARNVAKDTRRWLLVNLQSDSDFACHALNRDVWREDLVENLVREGFIFWQAVSCCLFLAFFGLCLDGILRAQSGWSSIINFVQWCEQCTERCTVCSMFRFSIRLDLLYGNLACFIITCAQLGYINDLNCMLRWNHRVILVKGTRTVPLELDVYIVHPSHPIFHSNDVSSSMFLIVLSSMSVFEVYSVLH